jgi:hypothetical protein
MLNNFNYKGTESNLHNLYTSRIPTTSSNDMKLVNPEEADSRKKIYRLWRVSQGIPVNKCMEPAGEVTC